MGNTGPTRKVRRQVRARSTGRCEFQSCGLPATEFHHRYERGMGGYGPKSPAAAWINGTANGLDTCAWHNQWASNGDPQRAWELGWIIRQVDGQIPKPWLVPVLTVHAALPIYLSNVDALWAFDLDCLPEMIEPERCV